MLELQVIGKAVINLINVSVISLQMVSICQKLMGTEWIIADDISKDSFYGTWPIGHPTLALLGLLLFIQTFENLLTILLHTKRSQHFQTDLIRLHIKPLHARKSFHPRRVSAFKLIKPLCSSIPDQQFVLLRALKIHLYISVISPLSHFFFISTFKCILLLS